MPPLHRAVAVAEHRDAAAVPENLGLDVSRALEVALAENGSVAERSLRFAGSGSHCLVELGGGTDDAHAAAPASGGSLDEERVADLVGRALRQRRHARLARDPLRLELVATEPERVRRRADPGEPGGDHILGEPGVLREKAVTGVDGVGSGLEGRAHVLGRVEVRGDLNRLVGRACVQRTAIVGRDDRDRLDSEPGAGAENANGDLTAVRDHESPDGHGRTLRSRREGFGPFGSG